MKIYTVLMMATITPIFAQSSEELERKFDETESRIVRFQPAAFPELPHNVVRDLQRRGCTIPQEVFTKSRNNVIRGEFAKPGQTDWAVLCSVEGVSTILVFWNGSERTPAEIASMADRNFLQGVTADEIGYSRGISAVGESYIMEHYQAYGGPKPPPMNHQGVNDAFLGKASEVQYFYDGKWVRLTGAD
jgi:hypothetical protein